jgi:predicted transcriptional regulator
MKKTAPISFRIKPELKDDLTKLAAADRRSLSAYIELALEAHVDATKKKRKDRPR